MLHPFAPNGVVVGECLVLGEILLSGGFLIGLFESLLPLFNLIQFPLVGEVDLFELLFEALVHYLEVCVFDALACVAGELFDFGHRLGLLFFLLKEIFCLRFVPTTSGSPTPVIRLSCHCSILVLSGVLSFL